MLYVDPSTGSIVLQVLFAAVLGTAATARHWWHNAAARIRRLFRRGP